MNQPRFIPLRWRFILPLYIILLVVTTTGAYLLARQMDQGAGISPVNILQQSRRAVEQQAVTLYDTQRRAAQSVAVADGVFQVLTGGDAAALGDSLAARAGRMNLDDVILVDAGGQVMLALRRLGDNGDYARLIIHTLADEPLVQAANQVEGTAGFARISGETMLYTAVPVQQGQARLGTALVGHRLPWVLASVHTSVLADAVLFDPDGDLLASTLTSEVNPRPVHNNQPQPLELDGEAYQTLYFPFVYGSGAAGMIGLLLPADAGAAADAGYQLTGLLMAVVVAAVLIVVFVGVGGITARLNRISRTAEALTRGERTARTQMQPTDEIGRLGHALDAYADYAQERQDILRDRMRRQRRENERLVAVLEALPDGVIVQDLDGRVLLMNEPARRMLGSRRALRNNPDFQELTAFVTDRLGPALAPGIYSLGEPQPIRMDDRILSAQAAMVTTITRQRIGTVITLRDVTEEYRVVAARMELLRQIETDVQEPLADLIQPARSGASGDYIASEIRHHSGALQKMILEMQELTDSHLRKVAEEQQRPLLLDTLVWAIANEWRQVAQAQNLTLHVIIEKSDLYVLGEERRLRWAIGNLIDNAIKYTPPGGDLTLEIREETSNGRAHLRVRDNGVGIQQDELRHVFTRFYRGKPTTKDGRMIRVPGSGQGLTVARQIFQAHGGDLALKSKPGVGTAAYFTIPLTSPVSLELPLPLPASDLEGETVRIDPVQIENPQTPQT